MNVTIERELQMAEDGIIETLSCGDWAKDDPLRKALNAVQSIRAALQAAPAQPAQGLTDGERLDWLLSGKRSKYIWNHVLTDEERDLGNSILEVIERSIQKGQQS